MELKLFGWKIIPDEREFDAKSAPQITSPVDTDGSIPLESGDLFQFYINIEGMFKTDAELINKYRSMAMHAEVDSAIEDIINESIVHDEQGKSITIIMDDLEEPDAVKTKIRETFDEVLKLLEFSNYGKDIFRQWYIDGRIYYQVVVDQNNPTKGIKNLVFLDPRKLKKVKNIKRKPNPETGVAAIDEVEEFWLYNDKQDTRVSQPGTPPVWVPSQAIKQHQNSVKLAKDTVVGVTSGLVEPASGSVASYLHKAIRPLNMLRWLEDASLIFRISRAPERRVFYVDVSNMGSKKQEEYLKNMMQKFRNKLVYDPSTGNIIDDRKVMSILEDFWIPRRGEGKGTEIQTLQGGTQQGIMEEIDYFQKNLYKALHVPISRLDSGSTFSLGKSAEITRDEIKFAKFVAGLRGRFTLLFDDLMAKQLVLKKVCSLEEWNLYKEDIHYDFLEDNNYAELKNSELWNSRMSLMGLVDPFVGRYFSMAWVKRTILKQDEEEVKQIKKEIEEETKSGEFTPPTGLGGADVPPGQEIGPGQPGMPSDGLPGQDEVSPLDDAFATLAGGKPDKDFEKAHGEFTKTKK